VGNSFSLRESGQGAGHCIQMPADDSCLRCNTAVLVCLGKWAVAMVRRQFYSGRNVLRGQSHFRMYENWDSPRRAAATVQFNSQATVDTALPFHVLALSQRGKVDRALPYLGSRHPQPACGWFAARSAAWSQHTGTQCACHGEVAYCALFSSSRGTRGVYYT
jgi:hypothetical protein